MAEAWLRALRDEEVRLENIRLQRLYPDDDAISQSSDNEPCHDSIPLDYPTLYRSIRDIAHQEKSIYIASSPETPNTSPDETLDEPVPPLISLSPDQERVLDLVRKGHNVFLTGPAGSGKSLIIDHIRYHFFKKGIEVAITAPTGIAAVQIHGQTIHSWSGVGKGEKSVHDYVAGIGAHHGQRKSPWKYTRVLIIDEISMVRKFWGFKE